MEFRSAARADVEAIRELVESAYRGDSSRAGWTHEADLLDGQRTDAAAVTEALPDLVLGFEGPDLIACCQLVLHEGHAYFGMFSVRPGLQGGGLGSKVLAEAERRAAAAGSTYVEMTVLSVRLELIAFYVRRGYVDTLEQRPFPYGDERFGVPTRDDLVFTVLRKQLS